MLSLWLSQSPTEWSQFDWNNIFFGTKMEQCFSYCLEQLEGMVRTSANKVWLSGAVCLSPFGISGLSSSPGCGHLQLYCHLNGSDYCSILRDGTQRFDSQPAKALLHVLYFCYYSCRAVWQKAPTPPWVFYREEDPAGLGEACCWACCWIRPLLDCLYKELLSQKKKNPQHFQQMTTCVTPS